MATLKAHDLAASVAARDHNISCRQDARFRNAKLFSSAHQCGPLDDRNKGSCRVLDIGGGWGDNFLLIGRALGSDTGRLSYSIVDNDRVTKLGGHLYKSCRDIAPKFMSDLSDAGHDFDYIMLCGTLPYIDDWQSFLRQCKQLGQSIYIARTAITHREGFYTHQTVFVDNASAGAYPYRVFGLDELTTEMSDWRLVLERKTDDYSTPFAQLPGKIEAAYFAHLWSRAAATNPDRSESRAASQDD